MGTPWRRFLTPARCGQTTSRIARPNSDDDGSGSPSLGDVTCASGTQLHVGAGDRRVVTTGSAVSNDARWARRVGAASRPKGGRSTGLRHTIGRPRLSQWTQGVLSRTKARTENPHRNLARHGAISAALAPRQNNAAATQSRPQRSFRLNLRPGVARRLSEAGRHWAPIARQRATREERQSGRTGPTYCKNTNGCRPSWTACCALSPAATVAVHRKTNTCICGFFERPSIGSGWATARASRPPDAVPPSRGEEGG